MVPRIRVSVVAPGMGKPSLRHWKAGEGLPDAATVRATVELVLAVAPRGWVEIEGGLGGPTVRAAGVLKTTPPLSTTCR